jgi:hypothetical protein
MNLKSLCILGLLLTTLATGLSGGAAATAACSQSVGCTDVTVNNNFVVTYRTCDSHSFVFVQAGVHNEYCGNGTSHDVPLLVAN